MFFKGIKNLMVVFLFVFLLCHQTCLTVICEENSAQVYPHLIFQNGYYGYVNDGGKFLVNGKMQVNSVAEAMRL